MINEALQIELAKYPDDWEVTIDDDAHLSDGLRNVNDVSDQTWTTGWALPKPFTRKVVVLG